ncbi:MAG: hypothetical protein ACTHKX_06155 [Pseudolysinimonas sp.]
MRRALGAVLVFALALGLIGCTPGAEALPAETPPPSAACLGKLSFPALAVQKLNLALPVHGIRPEFTQYEVATKRGDGPCAPPGPIARHVCPLPVSPTEETVRHQVGATPEEVTGFEFAFGATESILELVTGRTADQGTFQYRLTAWHHEGDVDDSYVIRVVEACQGMSRSTVSGPRAATVFSGTEPYLVAYTAGQDVFLIESIRDVGFDGSVSRIRDTDSGLLPAAAIKKVRAWWTAHAAAYFARDDGGHESLRRP